MNATRTSHTIALGQLVLISILIGWAAIAIADPCLVVYPSGPCFYHYDPDNYYTVGPGDRLYDAAYDRGGEVLISKATRSVDLSIYQAYNLVGFVADTQDEGFYFEESEFEIVIDGFSHAPTTFTNVLLVFDDTVPEGCMPQLTIGGAPFSGMSYPAGDLDVHTPTGAGNTYSDVKIVPVDWRGCSGMRMWAFADEDGDGRRDGGECMTAFSHDSMVPLARETWGCVKALYR